MISRLSEPENLCIVTIKANKVREYDEKRQH